MPAPLLVFGAILAATELWTIAVGSTMPKGYKASDGKRYPHKETPEEYEERNKRNKRRGR